MEAYKTCLKTLPGNKEVSCLLRGLKSICTKVYIDNPDGVLAAKEFRKSLNFSSYKIIAKEPVIILNARMEELGEIMFINQSAYETLDID